MTYERRTWHVRDSGEYPWDGPLDWGEGPWQDEPDKVQWVDEATGLDCLALRAPTTGAWCGYVGVPPDHKLHGVPYQDVEEAFDVHGSLTFSERCQEGWPNPGLGICHVPYPGRPDDIWWFGFDCAHAGDCTPAMEAKLRMLGLPGEPKRERYSPWHPTYKTLAYVEQEVAKLAAQLKAEA